MLDTSDRPFALPNRKLISMVVDLPFPPSLNHIWRYSRKGVQPSKKYIAWKKQADGLALYQKFPRVLETIEREFEVQVLLQDGKRGDLDNLAKAVLDWAQTRRLIKNDKHCRQLTLRWVEKARAPSGCRLILTELA